MPEVEQKMVTRSIKVAPKGPVGGLMPRIIPSRLALDSNPEIKPDDILMEKDIHAMLREKAKQEVVAISNCDCRSSCR
jgi:hypothetical protein